MNRRTGLIAAFVVSIACWAVIAVFAVHALAAPDKPEDIPWCVGSDPAYCNPTDEPALAPIPPDLPPAVKLRAQLAKERKQHAQQIRALRKQIRELEAR